LKKRFGCEVFSYREGWVYGNTLWFCYVGVLVVTCECYGEFIFNAKKMCCITLGKGFWLIHSSKKLVSVSFVE
jgi:hypothetical protein